MPRRLLALALIALAATALPPGARAQQVVAQEGESVTLRITSNRELQRVVTLLLRDGRADDARALIRAWQPDHPDHAVRVAYVEGLIASAQGDDAEAVRIYREILAARPELERVRLALAAALFRLEDDDAAAFQARQLIAAGVDDRIGGTLQSLIKTIDARRPVRFRGFASILPSTNVTGGSRRQTVTFGGRESEIDDGEESGIGALVGGEVLLRGQIDADTAAVGQVAGTLRHYPDIERTLLGWEVAAGVERQVGRRLRVLPQLTLGGNVEDWTTVRRFVGGRVELSATLPPAWRVFASPSLIREEYPDLSRDLRAAAAQGSEATLAGADGTVLDVPVQLDRFIGPGRFVRAIGGYRRGDKNADRYTFQEWRAGAGAYAELPWGLTLYGQGTYAWRDYEGGSRAVDGDREDRRLLGLLAVTKRDLAFRGFAPRVTYSYERNRSNDPFQDRESHDLELRFTREF